MAYGKAGIIDTTAVFDLIGRGQVNVSVKVFDDAGLSVVSTLYATNSLTGSTVGNPFTTNSVAMYPVVYATVGDHWVQATIDSVLQSAFKIHVRPDASDPSLLLADHVAINDAAVWIDARAIPGVHLDGSTDDHAVLQPVLDSFIANNGGTLLMPVDKTAALSTGLTIGNPAGVALGVCIKSHARGGKQSQDTFKWVGASGGGPMLTVRNAYTGVLEGLTFDGNGLAKYCVQFLNVPGDSIVVEYWDVRNCAFFDAQIYNVVIDSPTTPRSVSDMVTNGTTTITSATAGFSQADVGAGVNGTNIPASTYITSVSTSTTAVMTHAATGSGTGGTLNITGGTGDESIINFSNCAFRRSQQGSPTHTTAHVYHSSANALGNSFVTCQFDGDGTYPTFHLYGTGGSCSLLGCSSSGAGTAAVRQSGMTANVPFQFTVHGHESQDKSFLHNTVSADIGDTVAPVRTTTLSGVFQSDITSSGVDSIQWNQRGSPGALVLIGSTFSGNINIQHASASVFDLGTNNYNSTGFTGHTSQILGLWDPGNTPPFKSSFASAPWYGSIGTYTAFNVIDQRLSYTPFTIDSTQQFQATGLQILNTPSGSSVFRLGIYADDGFGKPGRLVHASGTISAAGGPGFISDAGIGLLLTPGLYWLAGVGQGAPGTAPQAYVLATVLHPKAPLSGTTLTQLPAGYYQDGVSGALPGTPSGLSINTPLHVVIQPQ